MTSPSAFLHDSKRIKEISTIQYFNLRSLHRLRQFYAAESCARPHNQNHQSGNARLKFEACERSQCIPTISFRMPCPMLLTMRLLGIQGLAILPFKWLVNLPKLQTGLRRPPEWEIHAFRRCWPYDRWCECTKLNLPNVVMMDWRHVNLVQCSLLDNFCQAPGLRQMVLVYNWTWQSVGPPAIWLHEQDNAKYVCPDPSSPYLPEWSWIVIHGSLCINTVQNVNL